MAETAEELARAAEGARLKREQLAAYARRYLGTRYLAGGDNATGMDTGGFLYRVYLDAADTRLPRDISSLYNASRPIDPTDREPGDLVFFRLRGMNTDHAGMYLGNSQFIHALYNAEDEKAGGVRIDDLGALWWRSRFSEIRRVLPSSRNPVTGAVSQGPSLIPQDPADRFEPLPADSNEIPWPLPPPRTAAGDSGSWFSRNMDFDMRATVDWSLFSMDGAVLYIRGGSFMGNWRYEAEVFTFGFGVGLTVDVAMSVVRLPLVFNVMLNDNWEVYIGPVFSVAWFDGISTAQLPDKSGEGATPSIFPGVIGISWRSNYIPLGTGYQFALTQDAHYSVYTNDNQSALPALEAFTAGLTFSTGISVRPVRR